jgi:hypothetical protein
MSVSTNSSNRSTFLARAMEGMKVHEIEKMFNMYRKQTAAEREDSSSQVSSNTTASTQQSNKSARQTVRVRRRITPAADETDNESQTIRIQRLLQHDESDNDTVSTKSSVISSSSSAHLMSRTRSIMEEEESKSVAPPYPTLLSEYPVLELHAHDLRALGDQAQKNNLKSTEAYDILTQKYVHWITCDHRCRAKNQSYKIELIRYDGVEYSVKLQKWFQNYVATRKEVQFTGVLFNEIKDSIGRTTSVPLPSRSEYSSIARSVAHSAMPSEPNVVANPGTALTSSDYFNPDEPFNADRMTELYKEEKSEIWAKRCDIAESYKAKDEAKALKNLELIKQMRSQLENLDGSFTKDKKGNELSQEQTRKKLVKLSNQMARATENGFYTAADSEASSMRS